MNPAYLSGFNHAKNVARYADLEDEIEDATENVALYTKGSEMREYWRGWLAFMLTLRKNGV